MSERATADKAQVPNLSSPVAAVLERLQRVRRSGNGWHASCPGPNHERGDRDPSLSVAEGRDGRALLFCFGGCAVEDIVRSLGLELRDLYPDQLTRARHHHRPARPFQLQREVAAKLVASTEFAFAWLLAQTLAQLPARAARVEVLRAWDAVTARCDPGLALELAYLFRGIAILRSCTARNVNDPDAVARAVRSLARRS